MISLKDEFAKLGNEVREMVSIVKNQVTVWKDAVDAQIKRLDDWKNLLISNGVYRFDINTMKRGNTLSVVTTPSCGSTPISFPLACFQSQEDWGFNQVFIKIRRSSYSPTSETIYRIDNYYNDCSLILEKSGGCNILTLADKGVVADIGNGRTINQWILSANLPEYTSFQIEMEFMIGYGEARDYRVPLSVRDRGVNLLSNIRIKE